MLNRLRRLSYKYGLQTAGVLAFFASMVSLYMSEMAHWEPCNLCWFQRSIMFPLAFLLGWAAGTNDRQFVGYGMLLAGAGVGISFFHVLKLHVPSLQEMGCKVGVSCVEDKLIRLSGIPWLSIPLLTCLCFVFLLVCLGLAHPRYREENNIM
ncbi:disulfide bond formation protein B [Pasteuria penetrans]|uniref:disulfide bond formation protein B n=1 Tax=Pasteuria penetrans TaxID=86005 RepID=UPI000FBAF1D8|nr:disulfide bond formation protein B [Pasteuria penetrans]